MTVYDEDGITVTVTWDDAGKFFTIRLNDYFSTTRETIKETIRCAEVFAGVERLSSLWTWRLLDMQFRPHVYGAQPDLYRWTGRPWAR